MSDKKKYPRAFVEDVAEALLRDMDAFFQKRQIAGSMRRDKAFVGDLEILYIPKLVDEPPKDFFSPPGKINCANVMFDLLLETRVLGKRLNSTGHVSAWGPDNKLAVHTVTGLPIDFFATTEENWWVSLVIRTGGKATNLMLTTGANRLNRTLNAYGCGVTDRKTGEVIRATSERHVYELCGCADSYVEPELRL